MSPPSLTLYHYWRSTSSWRVRWALDHKGIDAKLVVINLLEGQSESPEHLARNPMGYVPALEIGAPAGRGKPVFLAESFAIIEWLEEVFPEPALLPGDPFFRARTRQICELINAGTQPLLNLGVSERHSPDAAEKLAWQQHWMKKGMGALETLVRESAGRYAMGGTFTAADIFLGPQVYSAARFEVTLEDYPTISRIHENLMKLPDYASSHPDRYKPEK